MASREQELVNAQVEVNRAVFLMNARNNRDHHPYSLMDEESMSDDAIARHITSAVRHLEVAQGCYVRQGLLL